MRKARLFWWQYRWLIVGLLAITGFVLGYVGLDRYYSNPPKGVPRVDRTVVDLVWADIKLLTVGGAPSPPLPWELEIAQFLPLIVLYSALAGLVALFRDRVQQARLPFMRKHVVIAGLGVKGISFVEAMRSNGSSVVAIERDRDGPNVATARAQGAIVLIGDARDISMLATAGVSRAQHLVATADDSTNVEVALQAQALARGRRGGPLEGLAHVMDPDLCVLLKLHALTQGADPSFRVDFFNFYDEAARTLCRETLTGEERVAVVGSGPLSDRIVLHSLRDRRPTGTATSPGVTLVDRAATTRVQVLANRFPSVGRGGRLQALNRTAEGLLADSSAILPPEAGPAVIFLADSDNAVNVELALALKDTARATGSRVVVCTDRADGLAALLTAAGAEGSSLEAVVAVAVARQTCTRELVTEGIYELLGRTIHEEYVRSRRAEGALASDDPSLVPWEELDESLKSSNRSQAQHIGVKLRTIGCDLVPLQDAEPVAFKFTDAEVELLGRMEHERWMAERRADGWRQGPERDVRNRTTPYLVPWEDLAEEIRERDRETVRKLPLHAALAGFQIIRLRRGTGAAR